MATLREIHAAIQKIGKGNYHIEIPVSDICQMVKEDTKDVMPLLFLLRDLGFLMFTDKRNQEILLTESGIMANTAVGEYINEGYTKK